MPSSAVTTRRDFRTTRRDFFASIKTVFEHGNGLKSRLSFQMKTVYESKDSYHYISPRSAAVNSFSRFYFRKLFTLLRINSRFFLLKVLNKEPVRRGFISDPTNCTKHIYDFFQFSMSLKIYSILKLKPRY